MTRERHDTVEDGATEHAGQITRRNLLLSSLAAMVSYDSVNAQSSESNLPVRVQTLNHVSFGCADLPRTVAWFERVLGIPRHAFQDYGSGQTVLRAGSDPPSYIALSQRSPESLNAAPTRRPHFCWGIEDFDVQRIFAALAEMRIQAQSVLREGTTINGVNFDGPDGAPLQFNPIIACGGVGFLGEVCDGAAEARQRPGDPPPIQVRTMNHMKYMVSDLEAALAWYLQLTDMQIVAYQERTEGPRTAGYRGPPIPVLRIGAGPQHLALVEGTGPEAFRMHVGFGVENFDADQVLSRLAEHGVTARIRMREGVTAEVLVDGPDDVRIQLQDVSYCGGGGALGNVCSR